MIDPGGFVDLNDLVPSGDDPYVVVSKRMTEVIKNAMAPFNPGEITIEIIDQPADFLKRPAQKLRFSVKSIPMAYFNYLIILDDLTLMRSPETILKDLGERVAKWFSSIQEPTAPNHILGEN